MGEQVQAGYRSTGRWLAWLLLGVLAVACPAVHACSAGPAKWMSAAPGYYDSYAENDIVVGWTRAVVNYYVDCDPTASARVYVRAQGKMVGFTDGRAIFSTDHDGIGVQVEFRYIRAVSGSGEPEYSEWQAVGSAGTVVTAYANYVKSDPTASLPIEVDYRFVALRDFAGEDILMGDLEPLAVRDMSYGLSLQQLSVEGVRRRPREHASCEFSSAPPSTLTVPSAHLGMLRELGDVGPPANFSFAWRCRAGNQGHSGRGDFRFLSAAAVSGVPGHLTASGTARGVDMLVTLQRADGSQDPILFDRWYANILAPGAGGLPSAGSQSMQVRFIRNADALRAGSASSTLTIQVVPF